MEIDYKKIIIDGLLNDTPRQNLDLYFERQFQYAREKNYSLTEFFSGLFNAIKNLSIEAHNNKSNILKDIKYWIEATKTKSFQTTEEAEEELKRLKDKCEGIIKQEPFISVSNDKYSADISVSMLLSVSEIINLTFHKVKNNSSPIQIREELPEPIPETDSNKIRMLHKTGIIDFLIEKYPHTTTKQIADFFEFITEPNKKGNGLISKNTNSLFTTDQSNEKYLMKNVSHTTKTKLNELMLKFGFLEE